MNSRERLLTVFQRKVPDRMPVVPDEVFMMPARLTGKPFWEVFVNDNPRCGGRRLHSRNALAATSYSTMISSGPEHRILRAKPRN